MTQTRKEWLHKWKIKHKKGLIEMDKYTYKHTNEDDIWNQEFVIYLNDTALYKISGVPSLPLNPNHEKRVSTMVYALNNMLEPDKGK
jgi:hypothetical protein